MKVYGVDGQLLFEHYYRDGEHIYEIPREAGQSPARVCFEDTPAGDGRVLWEEQDGVVSLYSLSLRAVLPRIKTYGREAEKA